MFERGGEGRRRPPTRIVAVAMLVAGVGAGPSAVPASGASPPEVRELLARIDDLLRGDSSQGRMTMRVVTRRYERTMTMESWSQGSERSLIRILEPAKERGTATLKVGDRIWNYLPKVDRTIKVPASMMGASWMGSHFTNDDLVQETRYSDDFDCDFAAGGGAEAGSRDDVRTIACVPHEETPVVWGRVEMDVDVASELPREARFYDEDGELRRTMEYGDVQTLGGRRLPTRIRMTPADDPGEFTEMSYADLRFDVDIPERTFTLQALRR